MGEIFIGTSGWMYKSWAGKFYPDKVPPKSELAFYAKEFSTVEVDSSYYKLPSVESCESWAEDVPGDFSFAFKASRYLTHMKKLKDAKDPWQRIVDASAGLGKKLGPILLQFPRSWKRNEERLAEFLEVTGSHKTAPKLVFEFRNESWNDKNILRLLEEHNAAWCIADSHRFERHDYFTADFTYIRYHGRTDINPKYSKSELKKEAAKIVRLSKKGLAVFVYFNNDAKGYAIENARTLRELLE